MRRIIVDNAFPELSEAGEALARPLENSRITVTQLFGIASAIEKLYVDRGYPLVRVTVPPQRLTEGGDAHVAVTDGFIEAVSLTGVPEHSRAAVSARVEILVGRRKLKYAELERAVLIAGDVAGLKLRSALASGKTPGGVILALEGDERLVSASVSTGNNLPQSLGVTEFNARLALNNPLGFGEQAYLSLSSGYAMGLGGFPMSPLRTIGAGFIAPLGADGWTVNPEVTQSLTRPSAPTGTPASTGAFERFSFRSSFPIERTHDETFTLNGALEAISQQLNNTTSNVIQSHDEYAALRLGANWQGAAFWGEPTQVNAQFSQGLDGRNPGSASNVIPLSRQGAGPYFSKIDADIKLSQSLVSDFRLDLSGHAQWAFNRAQLTSEQFALDGADALSAFTQGAFSVDAGETMRVEATRSFALSYDAFVLSLSPYLFAAQGYGALYDPTRVEQARIAAAAFGLGARVAFDSHDGMTGGIVGIELGRGVSNVASERGGYRGIVSITLHY